MSNYVRHKKDANTIITGSYFSHGLWHVIEMILDDHYNITSESLIQSVSNKQTAQSTILSRSGKSVQLEETAKHE